MTHQLASHQPVPRVDAKDGAVAEPANGLVDAFQLFNEVSIHLASSFYELENRVDSLTGELAAARNERLAGLAEKDRLANRLRSLLDALPGGVVVLDGDGRVQDCNPAAVDLLGEPLLGSAWREVIRRAFAPRDDDGHEISLRDGRRVGISTSPLLSEPGQILLLKDLTETRRLQERLNHDRRLAAMGSMVAALAHQIRTPLASVLLYASHLNRPVLEAADRQRAAERIQSRMRHLEGLINDMLLFARDGNFAKSSFPAADLVTDLQRALDVGLQAHDCHFATLDESNGVVLCANREMLLSALQNLANNAMQACGTGGQLLFIVRTDAVCIDLMMCDNGPGIAQALQERVFEPFFTTRTQGTGLGLAVVRAIAEAHGGSAWMSSQPGIGSTFGLRLPLNTADLTAGQRESASDELSRRSM
ncbi:MAG: sensor histidine kinase [Acidiferrobacterales bacterium]